MNQPAKWRETCDPFALPYRTFRLLEVLGYPYAGNDVFYTAGIHGEEPVRAYVKVERQRGAAVANEVMLLRQRIHPAMPELLDWGEGFCVTKERPGVRLSVLLGDKPVVAPPSCLREYGRTLAWLHSRTPQAQPVADRRFFHRPSASLLEKLALSALDGYFAEPPASPALCFCHGDFHYANLLWQDWSISGILDLELAGYGDRDFDIAWALLPRPGQRFLLTQGERQLFLEGYSELGSFDERAVRYHMAKAAVYFLSFCSDEPDYCALLRRLLADTLDKF